MWTYVRRALGTCSLAIAIFSLSLMRQNWGEECDGVYFAIDFFKAGIANNVVGGCVVEASNVEEYCYKNGNNTLVPQTAQVPSSPKSFVYINNESYITCHFRSKIKRDMRTPNFSRALDRCRCSG